MVPKIEVLEEIGQLSMAQLDALPLPDLAQLIQQVSDVRDTVRHYEGALLSTLHSRFAERANQLRTQAGKTTGTVRFRVDGFVIIADLPKRPEYDQVKLKSAVDALRKWGENPDDYVGTEFKVSESRYNAWPPSIRQLFEPARTLKVGKPTYKLEQIKAGAIADAANDSHFGEVA